MYADDTTYFCVFDTINNTEKTIHDKLIKLTKWLECNQFSLNVNKLNLWYSIATVMLLIYLDIFE